MTLQWISASLHTGEIIADLPTLDPEWPLRRTISKYETATAILHLDGAPPNWEEAVLEGAALLACYDDDDPAQLIQWSGFVTEQERGTDDDAVMLSLVTTEGYLDRRYVGDKKYTNEGQDDIAADLVASYVAEGTLPGLPITTVPVTGSTNKTRSKIFQNTDNATVYARMGQLAALTGGIEWMIDWVWNDTRTGLEAQFIVGDHIGAPASTSAPAASFEMPGPVVTATLVRSFADGKGANAVTAYSSGQGATTPFSDPHRATDYAGRPVFAYRFQPASSVTSKADLNDWAGKALTILAPGQKALTLTCALLDTTRHGNLWLLGDDVGFQIGGLDQNGVDTVKCFPGGYAGVGRPIAYELTESIDDGMLISPILAVTSVDGSDDGS